MKKSFKIFNWIQSRYRHYDKIEGRNTGEKYTKKIFKEASTLFKMSVQEVHNQYNQCIAHMAKQVQENVEMLYTIKNFQLNPKLINATKLHNKKVKLNIESILKNKERYSKIFINFVKENKNNVFTAITDKDVKSMYKLKEYPTWLFKEEDLILVSKE